MRRVDRWIAATLATELRATPDPLVVDLGFGASPVTTVEMGARLRTVRPDVDVVGIEIDPERVRAAAPFARERLTFARGGFELGPLGDRRPTVVRAFNVLRQYDEAAAHEAWDVLCARLADGGALVEGTCDELGRLASWVRLGPAGPRTLTFAAHLPTLDRPSKLAERLPKALIHRHVPGEAVHGLLADLDDAWTRAAPASVFGPRQRWLASVESVAVNWPIAAGERDRRRWRLGELTIDWAAVAPRS